MSGADRAGARAQESVTVTGQMQGVAAQNEWLGQVSCLPLFLYAAPRNQQCERPVFAAQSMRSLAFDDPTLDVLAESDGVLALVWQAVGSEATRDRLMATGDRYASNHYDESRFNLPEGYYEKVQQKELEERIKMGEAKRAGKVYKREEEEHVSTAILPPSLAQPAPVTGCWVGGTCVPCTRHEYTVMY
eukprot:3099593-Rhodomonas_salina.2